MNAAIRPYIKIYEDSIIALESLIVETQREMDEYIREEKWSFVLICQGIINERKEFIAMYKQDIERLLDI